MQITIMPVRHTVALLTSLLLAACVAESDELEMLDEPGAEEQGLTFKKNNNVERAYRKDVLEDDWDQFPVKSNEADDTTFYKCGTLTCTCDHTQDCLAMSDITSGPCSSTGSGTTCCIKAC